MHTAIALRISLFLSDARYDLLTRFVPGWLPPLGELRAGEAAILPSLVKVVDTTGKDVGWQVQHPEQLLRQAVEAHMEAGGMGCRVVVKVGTDNFSVGSKKLGTLAKYQQVAAIPIFTTPAPGSAPQTPVTPSQPAQSTPAGSSLLQVPPVPLPPCPALEIPVPGAAPAAAAATAAREGWEYTDEELVKLGIPVADAPELARFMTSLLGDGPSSADLDGLAAPSSPPRPQAPPLDEDQAALDAEIAAMKASWEEDVCKSVDVPYNSPLQAIPLAFCKGSEDVQLLKVRADAGGYRGAGYACKGKEVVPD